MQWLNPPRKWQVTGNSIFVTSDPNSDFWRITHYGFIRDTGHFYFTEADGDFQASVQVIGNYHALYDQAGLMVRVDEENWMKCGVEYVDGVQHASVVSTRHVSDWSVLALPGNPPSIYLRVLRKSDYLEVSYSLDNSAFTMMRLAYLVPQVPTQVGVMCASPQGPGFEVRFDDFRVESV